MSVDLAIAAAERLLPGEPNAIDEQGLDPRWQAIIAVGEYIRTDPEPVWEFARRWGATTDEDLRDAVTTCLLEHLLEHHFAEFFPRIEAAALADPRFGACFAHCWPMGQAAEQPQLARFESLKSRVAAVQRIAEADRRSLWIGGACGATL